MQKTRLSFEDLCRALNMDEEASNRAWRSYENISKNYTLEVRRRATYCFLGPVADIMPVWACTLERSSLCVQLNASIELILKKALCVWERERVIVCVLWCLLVVDLAQGSGFRSASSPRPYLSLHTELWSSSAFQMKCY